MIPGEVTGMSAHSPKFVLNFATGSVSFNFSVAGAQELQSALQDLMGRIKMVGGQSTTDPQAPLDYTLKQDGLRLEVFCNPNIWPSPHAAKVLVTLKTDPMRISTETELTQMLDDLGQFMEMN